MLDCGLEVYVKPLSAVV